MKYKWRLKKGGRKEICPACGQKRFVPYVATADGVTKAGPEFGRCDRETSCGYNRYPDKQPTTEIKPAPVKITTPLRFFPSVVRTRKSNLFDYVVNIIGVDEALQAWDAYKVGRTQDGRTLFWQIDINGEVRAGKAIKYKPDGHRDKQTVPPVAWAHKLREFAEMKQGDELQQCFFGEHLLKDNKPVAVVESEKTAVVLSAFFPAWTWLACGGSQNLKNADKNKVLAGRKVMLIPDNNQYSAWYDIALKYKFSISDVMEKYPIFEGADVLDLITEAHEKFNF